jgi:transcription initiation factor TFIIE subunit beta
MKMICVFYGNENLHLYVSFSLQLAALSLDDILDETNQLDVPAKHKHWLLTEALRNNPKIKILNAGNGDKFQIVFNLSFIHTFHRNTSPKFLKFLIYTISAILIVITVEGMDERKIEDYLEKQGITSMQDVGIKKVVHSQKRKKAKKNNKFKKLNEHLDGVLQEPFLVSDIIRWIE